MSFWQVIVPVPLRREFTYEIPPMLGIAAVGKRVLVPFGGRRLVGYLFAEVAEPVGLSFKIKSAIRILDDTPAVSKELLELLVVASEYYLHPKGEVLKSALPPGTSLTEKNGKVTARIAPKTVTWVVVIDSDGLRQAASRVVKRAPKQAMLMNSLADEGALPMRALRQIHGTARKIVTQLFEGGWVRLEERPEVSDPFGDMAEGNDTPPTLTDEQHAVVGQMTARVDKGGYEGFLLHGITGSGKTEVYLRVIDRVRQKGKGALVLVPEIALTPQLVHRYRVRFGDRLAVWHSGLSERDRYNQWRALRDGDVQVAIGVRSAVFAPIQNLGIIVVDEEHDSSFKQETGFRYHARDLALLRAAKNGAVAVLGSATPSLESLGNVQFKKLTRLVLERRATAQPLPSVQLVDMTGQKSGPKGQEIISKALFDAVNETLEKGEQTILFLNRRGFAPALLCKGCGTLVRCEDCAVSMTFHKHPRGLVCHYCGAERPVPRFCDECGAPQLDPVGVGTQKVEEIVADLFPNARVARLDRDTGAGAKAEKVLDRLRNREIDILVGTQMVTKGHDFPDVTLVGVLNADVGLQMPDFRAAERTFQLLTQVAGRAGRSKLLGRALIQTRNPGHPAVALAKTHDFNAFSQVELLARQELGYPPFGRLTLIRLSSKDENLVAAEARTLFAAFREQRIRLGLTQISLLGPAPAPMPFVQQRFRYRILIKAARQDEIRTLVSSMMDTIEAPKKGVRIAVDVDPYSML